MPTFGKIGAWLGDVRKKEDFRQVTDFVRDYVIRTCPVGPGDVVLAMPVEQRRLHSIYTAAKETGAHPKRLRKLLDRAGLLQPAHESLSDNHVLFDAEAAREVLGMATNHLSLPGLAARLGLSVIQARSLVSAGVIVPFTPSGNGIGTPAFSMEAVDRLMARLLADAVPLDEAMKVGRVVEPVVWAFKRAQCSLAEVVALVLERKLGWVAARVGGNDLSALFVDVTEVREHVRGRELTGLTFLDAQFVLRRSYPVVKALVEQGMLRTHMSVHPETRAPIRVIDRDDIEKFKAEYVSLFDLARERGNHHLKIKAELEAAGIQPALRQEVFSAAFYRKSALPR
ncbi:hypothetical protein [Methylobacterium sp. B4]|uniref:hypothetical protein n=1 Tax=Methylobacterium sp. B4 TaxID=1938755 RepID=UPI0011B42980|nr:hypothetical protein [Methylobacterium sp. B4]